MSDKIWALATTGAARQQQLPQQPRGPRGHQLGEAVAFALVSGAIGQLVRVMINHKTTQAYTKRKGHLHAWVTT